MATTGEGLPLRRRLARAPLWARLVAVLLLLLLLALALTGFVGIRMLHSQLVQQVDDQLALFAGPSKSSTGPVKPWHRSATSIHTAKHPYDLLYVADLDSYGGIADEPSVPNTGRPKLPTITATVAAERDGVPFTVDPVGSGPSWRVIVRPQSNGGTRVVAMNLGYADAVVRKFAWIDAAVGGLVLLILGVTGYALVRVAMRPLVEIEDTAETIADGQLSERVPERDMPSEVGRLGVALNGMLAQIEAAFHAREASEASARRSEDRMRTFIADASHELRTPLTSIRGFAELYRQEGGDDPAAAKVLRRIEEDAERMGLLVEDLLLLARMDQQRPLESRPVDLLSLAADAVIDAQTLAPDRDIDFVRLDSDDRPVTVTGDQVRLRQVITNLITNALTHTPAGTPFRVGVGMTARGATLEVEDEGPGLSAEQADRVFERFYRADPSRSRMHGGSGLGLSIVAALVRAHHGTVEVDTAPGKGALFRVVIPVVAA